MQKRKKWPTGKEHIHNDGNQGWIDPCCDEYDKQFELRRKWQDYTCYTPRQMDV